MLLLHAASGGCETIESSSIKYTRRRFVRPCSSGAGAARRGAAGAPALLGAAHVHTYASGVLEKSDS